MTLSKSFFLHRLPIYMMIAAMVLLSLANVVSLIRTGSVDVGINVFVFSTIGGFLLINRILR